MPPEVAQKSASATWLKSGIFDSTPSAWRSPLCVLAAAITLLAAVTAREWGEMIHQWWNIDTYNHILLVPFIVGWLVWVKADELAKVTPRPWGWGLVLVIAGLGLWLTGRLTGINLIAHAGAVGAVQGAIVAILGPRVCALIALPLAYLAFLVPFGDELVPHLQDVTAHIAITLTLWSGIPAVIDGIHIDTPVGLFVVAEACSGVKFLIAMVTLSLLVSFTRFKSWDRRAGFVLASIVVPILANGVRAWGTIYIAQFAGVEFAAGFDHILYGWIFFAVVVVTLLAGAWKLFESETEDYGYTAADLRGAEWLSRFEAGRESTLVMLGSIAAVALAACIAAILLAPSALT